MVENAILDLDFVDCIRELATRFKSRVDQVNTEEGTKNALIMPFINHVLGYNVFDPTDVIPGFIADVGDRRGEKVDYAIFKEGRPIMLIECKQYGSNLERGSTAQLYHYFNATSARFGVLTDGGVYRFYSDLETQFDGPEAFP